MRRRSSWLLLLNALLAGALACQGGGSKDIGSDFDPIGDYPSAGEGSEGPISDFPRQGEESEQEPSADEDIPAENGAPVMSPATPPQTPATPPQAPAPTAPVRDPGPSFGGLVDSLDAGAAESDAGEAGDAGTGADTDAADASDAGAADPGVTVP